MAIDKWRRRFLRRSIVALRKECWRVFVSKKAAHRIEFAEVQCENFHSTCPHENFGYEAMQSNNPYDVPQQSAPSPSPIVGMRLVRIKRIDAVSAGMMVGALYAFIGLIVGGIVCMAAIVGVNVGGGSGTAVVPGVIGGLVALVGLPIFYGLLGFICGLIGAAIYNLAAGFVGGIQMHLEG